MAFSEQSLADARKQGYSDDEIFNHLSQSDERFSVAKQQGYSLDDIASHLKQKEGGVNYEDATSQSGQGPLDNRDAESAVQSEVQAGSTEGVQADSMLPAEDQSQFRSDDQARVTTGIAQGGELIEGQTKDAQGGIQGEEDGQGLPSQVSTGNEAQVISPQQAAMQAAPFGAEGVQSVPAKSFVQGAFESIRDFGAETFSNIGQGIYGSMAGIMRTEPEYIDLPSLGAKVKNPRFEEQQKLVNYFENLKKESAEAPEIMGAKPLEGIPKVAAEVTGGLLKLPAQVGTGLIGFTSLIGEAYGSAKEGFYQKAKEKGMSDDEAVKDSESKAIATTAAALPIYYIAGKGAGAISDKVVSEATPKIVDAALRVGLNTVANAIGSATIRGVTAALDGEDVEKAVKDVTVPGLIQDFAFASHAAVTYFKEQAAKGKGKEAARDLPDPVLDRVAQDPRYAGIVAPEVAARAETRVAQQAKVENLPETAKVLEVTTEAGRELAPTELPQPEKALITPEAPPLAPEEAAPSLPKEEAKPPVSVAGEALVVEPTAEAPVNPIESFKSNLEESGLKYLKPFDFKKEGKIEDWEKEGGIIHAESYYPTTRIGNTSIGFSTEGMALNRAGTGVLKMIDADVDKNGNKIFSIEAIKTDPEKRGTGDASKALKQITDIADKSGLTIQLEPTPIKDFIKSGEKKLSKQQLVEWYKKNDFVQKYEGNDTILIREPKQAKAPAEAQPTKPSESQAPTAEAAKTAVVKAEPQLTDDQAATLRDIISLRKSQGQQIDPKQEKRLAEYDARKSGVIISDNEIASNLIIGHPLVESPYVELNNLIPIKIKQGENVNNKFTETQKIKNKAQEYIGKYSVEEKKAKTAAQKKAFSKNYNKAELLRQKEILDYINKDILPELERLDKLSQPTKPSEAKIEETSGLPTLERKPVEPETAVKAEEGVAPREGEGKEVIAAPEGSRVAAAAYLAPDGNVYEGKSHIEAMEKAKEAGAITQSEIDAKKNPLDRNTSEFGYVVTLPDGTRTTTTREAAGQIAKQSGQALKEQFDFGDKMHSNEVALDDFAAKEEIPKKRIGPGAAGIREFELRDIQQGAEIIKGYKDQNNVVLPYEDWKRNFESTLSYEGKYTEDQLKEFYDQSVSVANEAAKGKPIPEAIQQLDIPITKTGSTTALANAKIDEDRVNRGRPKLMEVARKDWGTSWEEAVYQIDQDSSVQDRLITELFKKPRAVNDTEGALLVHRLITKKNEYDNLIDRLEKGGLSLEEQADLRNKITVLDDQIYGLEALGKSVGTETARGLNFRKAMIANDYSLEGMRTKVRAAKNGEKLTPEEEEKIKQLHDSIKTGEEESERIQNEEKEKFSKEDTKDFIESAKSGSRQRKEKETPEQSLARLKDVAKSRMEDYPKLASTIRKIAISFVDKGITEREPLLDAVHGFLKDEVGMPNSWTRQETSDAICQYGIFRTLNKNATMEAFRKINGQLLELGKRADIVAGEAPKKTGMERAKPDVEARKIARENRKLIKKYNIKTEDPETQLAGALEGIKNKLKNEIEDLSLRIKTGEQAPSKEGAPSDPEIASLKELRASLQAQFEIMYGKPEKAAPTYEEQVTAAERAYEKLIEKKKEILANQGITDLKPAKPEITSAKIEKQKAEIQELNAELKAMRSADSARNEEIKKNQLGQRIEQLKKKIAGEVKEKAGEAYGPESEEVTNLKKEIELLQQTLDEMKPKKSPEEKEIERLQAAIDDVNDRIASGEKVAPTAKKEPLTEYAKKLREDLEMARKQLKEVTKPEPKSEEQKKIDSINRQIEQKKKQLAEKSVPQKKEKYDVASLERSEAVKELQSLRDQIKSEDWYIASRQQAAIDSYVARQNKVANEYLRRIEEQDFAPRQKIERVLNSRELEAQANTEKAKAKFQKELALYNYKNRTKEQKILDFIVNFSRAMLLSHITTLTKLAVASVEIASLKPLKATAGYAWKLLPPVKEIAKLAPTEGGGKPSEDVRLFVKGIVEGIKDFPEVFKIGQSKIDAMVKEKTRISNSVLEYFSHLHKAMKNPVFTGEFKTSLNRYLNWMEKQGMDIHDPVNQKTAMDAAYRNAQRSIFSEDNSIVNYINTAISIGKRSNNKAVSYSAYALQFDLPIVKIPTNIIKQVFLSQLGSGIAAAKITKAMIKGIDTLSPMEADTIMRQLKVGSIGLAMFAWGAMRPDMFGGLHLAGITEEDEDLPTGGANILGFKVPRAFFDNPILIAAQVGATVRKYWDAKAGEYGYKGEEAVDFAMAMATAEFELVKETPLLSLPKNIEQAMNVERTPENLGGLIADRIPGPIQDLAKALDTEEDGALPSIKALIGINKDIIKRKPDGSPPERFLQTIQKNLPYFRKQVPEK